MLRVAHFLIKMIPKKAANEHLLFSLLCFILKSLLISVFRCQVKSWRVLGRKWGKFTWLSRQALIFNIYIISLEIQPGLRKKVGDRYILIKFLRECLFLPSWTTHPQEILLGYVNIYRGIHPLRTDAFRTNGMDF